MAAKTKLLATAYTLGGIADAIDDFYAGCSKDLKPRADGTGWDVIWPYGSKKDGQPLEGMTVRKDARGLYRFEMAA